MKRTVCLLVAGAACLCGGCAKEKKGPEFPFEGGTVFYTVSFVQEGNTLESFCVEKGKALDESKIPQITTQKKGYTATWEEKNLSSIESDVTVNIIYTPNVYQVLYYLAEDGKIYYTQNVTYDATFELIEGVTLENKKFVRWKCKNSEDSIPEENWTKDGNLELFAVWEDEEDSWSPFG